MTEYILNKSFESRVARSDRVLAIAESFGIGLEAKEFHVLKDVHLTVNQGDVVYITGQSGSGKSQLLKCLREEMTKQGLKVVDIDSVELKDAPLIDQVGKDTNEALAILSQVGLNDAYLVVRKPKELSDGQLYRFKLALLFSKDADVWVSDEWGAVLDEVTRKTISFNAQKLARSLGKILVVANTHNDCVDELAPSVMVKKSYNDRIKIIEKTDRTGS